MTDRDPRDVRDEMVADYAQAVRSKGVTPELRDIERIVHHDLATYEAVQREAARAPAPAPWAPDKREDTAGIIAKQNGMQLYRDFAPKDRKTPLLDIAPRKVSEKFPFMLGRIRRIVETPPGVRAKSVREMVALCAYPKLARKFYSTWFFYGAPTTPHPANPFIGLSDLDRARKWIRLMEDLCDESSGVLGPWWVPK